MSIKAPFSLTYALSGFGYIVQIDDRWYLGSSFDHFFTETGVSQIRTNEIIEKTHKLFKTPFKTDDILAQTGIRVTIPRSILPILNPLPDTQHTWLFTGLGAKGLLMSALIAKDIPSYIFKKLEVPKALRFR